VTDLVCPVCSLRPLRDGAVACYTCAVALPKHLRLALRTGARRRLSGDHDTYLQALHDARQYVANHAN
jgi:hypothetical protein